MSSHALNRALQIDGTALPVANIVMCIALVASIPPRMKFVDQHVPQFVSFKVLYSNSSIQEVSNNKLVKPTSHVLGFEQEIYPVAIVYPLIKEHFGQTLHQDTPEFEF